TSIRYRRHELGSLAGAWDRGQSARVSEPQAMHRNSLTVPATMDALAEIAAFVLAEADAAGLGRQARYRLRLAVDELATNIIIHGRDVCSARPGAESFVNLEVQRHWDATRVTLS